MMKCIYMIIFLMFASFVIADTDSTFYTSRIGGNDTYFNSWSGNDDFGNFFDKGFLTIQEKIAENIQWFNRDMFKATTTTTGAISHLILLFSIIAMVTLAEVTLNPFFMLLAGFSMFFFGWFIILFVSMIVGFFMFPFSFIYLMRMTDVVKSE